MISNTFIVRIICCWFDVVMAAELVNFRLVPVICAFPLRLELVDARVVLDEAGPGLRLTQSRVSCVTQALLVLPFLCWRVLQEKIIRISEIRKMV